MAVAPPTKPSIRVVHTCAYRGGTREVSNRYFFNGNDAPTDADFAALWVLLKPYERDTFPASEHLVRVLGTHPGSEVPVWEVNPSDVGTLDESGMDRCPGDCAAIIRYTTTQRTTKNHPIYLWNYYKPCYKAPGGPPDTLVNNNVTQLERIGQAWVDGFSVGGATLKKCGPYGAVAQSRLVLATIRHRDFPN